MPCFIVHAIQHITYQIKKTATDLHFYRILDSLSVARLIELHNLGAHYLIQVRRMMKSGYLVSQAVQVRLTRKGMTKKDLADRSGLAYEPLLRSINNGDWTLRELEAIAPALDLTDGLAVIDLARQEQRLADSGLAA